MERCGLNRKCLGINFFRIDSSLFFISVTKCLHVSTSQNACDLDLMSVFVTNSVEKLYLWLGNQ